jgi:hypothetical protein
VTYPDGSLMVTYPDGRVLNQYPDGTRTLNDRNGVAPDPDTGQPLQPDAGPVPTPDGGTEATVTDVLEGGHKISSIAQAVGILGRVEAVEAVAEPLDGVLAVAVMAWEVWKALESAYATAGHSYGLMYGALDMDGPAYPEGQNSLDSEETIAVKRQKFAEWAEQARGELANGADGVALRNKILLRTAYLNSDPSATLDEIWRPRAADNEFYADHTRPHVAGNRHHQALEEKEESWTNRRCA